MNQSVLAAAWPGTNRISGIILAGGRSRRLGIDKATMPWPPASPDEERTASGIVGAVPPGEETTSQTLLRVTAATLAQVCDEIVLAGYRGRPPAPYAAVPDMYPDGGSLGGMYAGLMAARHDYALAVATDMPFLNVALLRWMRDQPADYDALVPVREFPEPLHAIYGKACLEPMRRRLESGRLKITGFFDDVRVRYIDTDALAPLDPDGLSFFNINTPEDLDRARQILAARAAQAA